MRAIVRPARAEELQAAEELVARSINDLTERHGFGRIATLRPAEFQLFSLRDDPDGLWVAETDGELAGFAFSWVTGDLWFLAELFVSPAHQGSGIGNALMGRMFEHARKAGASNRALITFAFNTVSQGLYIKHGLFPRLPLYLFQVAGEACRHGAELQYTDIDLATDLEKLAQLDLHTLGVSREKHHRFLQSQSAIRGVMFHSDRDCVGYAYVSANGPIGPLGVVRHDMMGPAFRTALALAAASGAPQVSAFIPGAATEAIGAAVAQGMRITLPMVLQSAKDFGDWSRYLPRNPGFM
jgi:ribosomal protein S18 acetylase RimI-like enzyme